MLRLMALLQLLVWTVFVRTSGINYQTHAFSAAPDVTMTGPRRTTPRNRYTGSSSSSVIGFHLQNYGAIQHLRHSGQNIEEEGWQLFQLQPLHKFLPSSSHQTSSSSLAAIRRTTLDTTASATTSTQLYNNSNDGPSDSESVTNLQKTSIIRGGASDGDAAASFETNEGDIDKSKKKKIQKRLLILWVHGLSIAVVFSYYPNLLVPLSKKLGVDLSSLSTIISLQALFETIKLPVWNFVHAVSGMLMGGTIITTTILEWMILKNNSHGDGPIKTVVPDAIQSLWSLESSIVLPAVTGSMVSGLAQSYLMYDGIGFAPKYVKAALHTMLTFGIWWAIMDKKSQRQLVQAVEASQEQSTDTAATDKTNNNSVWMKRKIANVVSCVLVVLLYAIMVVKPFV
mmetsp:Transcript_44461/g.107591  ORF Transcript_44461/g.107591 Transcript_44461/m.107591 type:complete len:398 (-) Transcript_44461:2229-3422(-)